jgi:hypothetical protein
VLNGRRALAALAALSLAAVAAGCSGSGGGGRKDVVPPGRGRPPHGSAGRRGRGLLSTRRRGRDATRPLRRRSSARLGACGSHPARGRDARRGRDRRPGRRRGSHDGTAFGFRLKLSAASGVARQRPEVRGVRAAAAQRSGAHFLSPAMTESKTAVIDAACDLSAAVRPGPSHWITGVTPAPMTVTRYRSPGAGGRIAWLG